MPKVGLICAKAPRFFSTFLLQLQIDGWRNQQTTVCMDACVFLLIEQVHR
jgi:hypothetical protein